MLNIYLTFQVHINAALRLSEHISLKLIIFEQKIAVMEYYSSTYIEARNKFINVIKSNNGCHHKLMIDGVFGAENEELSIDIGVFGAKFREKILIHSSGVHGVKGFHGSAIQIKSIININSHIRNNECVIFIHCVNPYGMSHLRRFAII